MYRFFAPFIVLNSLFFATPVFGLTSITFDNNYAIFHPENNIVKFDLDKEVTILFLKKLEGLSLEDSPFALKIECNYTKNNIHIHFTLYKGGTTKNESDHYILNVSSIQNLELVWDMSGVTRIQVLVKEFIYHVTAFSWTDEQSSNSPFNITHIAFTTQHSLTIHENDSFLWVSDVLTACPDRNAEISCGLNINRQRFKSTEERNNSSSKGLRKVMEMKLLSKRSNPQYNYEMTIGVDQTLDKTEPRLHIMQHNITKLKMDTVVGPLNLNVNISSGDFVLGKNDSLPFLLWRDPVKKNNTFEEINYITVKVSENGHNAGKFHANSCKVTCKSMNDTVPWYTRWMNKLKAFAG